MRDITTAIITKLKYHAVSTVALSMHDKIFCRGGCSVFFSGHCSHAHTTPLVLRYSVQFVHTIRKAIKTVCNFHNIKNV